MDIFLEMFDSIGGKVIFVLKFFSNYSNILYRTLAAEAEKERRPKVFLY